MTRRAAAVDAPYLGFLGAYVLCSALTWAVWLRRRWARPYDAVRRPYSARTTIGRPGARQPGRPVSVGATRPLTPEVAVQRWITLTLLTASLAGLAAPARATEDPPPAATSVTLGEARIDPKVPGKVRVEVDYLCTVADEARSLTVSVEQKDPQDTSSIGFGSSRTAETDILCDGTPQHRQIAVQSKTVNWIPATDAVLTATVTNIGATPPAAADARRTKLTGP
ncbi:hypothetical protein ACIBCA_29765 [Kitasatospora sp. NPDC051170]|uniref:hypothetical protein n=1 Tax=Kitasatospora sp. NPDC051170 TaxID=3364056 RepID=UPI00378AD7B6